MAIESPERQAARSLERSRELLVKQHTQLLNSVRGQLAEFGIAAAQGRNGFAELKAQVLGEGSGLPDVLLGALRTLLDQIEPLKAAIDALEGQIVAAAKADPAMRRLCAIPGVGSLTAHAILAARYRTARYLSASWPPSATASSSVRQGTSRLEPDRFRL